VGELVVKLWATSVVLAGLLAMGALVRMLARDDLADREATAVFVIAGTYALGNIVLVATVGALAALWTASWP
jgi:hypothetical protein